MMLRYSHVINSGSWALHNKMLLVMNFIWIQDFENNLEYFFYPLKGMDLTLQGHFNYLNNPNLT